MFGHKIDTAATGYRLPDLHRAMDGARHQGNLTQLVAAIGYPWRQRVMLTLMRERLLVKRLEDDFHLLFKEFHVGGIVQHGRPKRFYFARMIATANAKDDAAAGENIGHSVVFGEAEGVPHGHNVKAAAKF